MTVSIVSHLAEAPGVPDHGGSPRPMASKVRVQHRGDGSGGGVGLALHRGDGAAARARRIPSLSMRACSVLRFNPSDAAAPFGPLITQFEASSASRMCR